MHIVELISTGDGQIMGTLHSVGIKLCVGCTERTLVVSFIILLFVCAVQCQRQCITDCV